MHVVHQAFHVVLLLGVLIALGSSFLILVGPLVFPGGKPRGRILRDAALFGGAALALFALDWVFHRYM